MALKSYHKETLNDNWFEERAAPLHGVLPRDGDNDYSTTAKAEFAGARQAAQRQKPRMITTSNISQALIQSGSVQLRGGFGSLLPAPDLEQEKRYFETTHHASFGSPVKSSHYRSSQDTSVPAGGAGGRRVERGKAASGTMGEVFKVHSDPQRDTQAQRSWMYSADPMIKALKQREASVASCDGNQSVSHDAKPENFKRKSTSITTVPRHHNGVFADDE